MQIKLGIIGLEGHITLRIKQCLSGDEINRQVNTISNHNYSLTKMDGILNIYYFKNNMEMENMDLFSW